MARVSKHESFLQIAETIALRGTCSRRKVGCVLNAMQRRLADVADGVVKGFDAINALRERLGEKE